MARRWSPGKKQPPRLRNTMKFLLVVLLMAFFIWTFGFNGYLNRLENHLTPPPAQSYDAIVVLTGGSGRIEKGVELITQARGQKLLISGVNTDYANETILEAINVSDAMKSCCIELGRNASDTVGNAQETAAWAKANDFEKILIITSDFHMDRALVELTLRDQRLEYIPLAIKSSDNTTRLAIEYSKYLISLLRSNIQQAYGQ